MLLVFFAFMGLMAGITWTGYKEGNWQKLIAPVDGNKRFCGIKGDKYDHTAFPFLFFPGLAHDPS